jgi:hypothetical protein
MKPLIENKGFKWKGFEIPAFTLNEGEMIRFWIQIIPTSDNISGYELARELKDILIKRKPITGLTINTSVSFAGDIDENKMKNLIYPLRVAEYLKKKRKLNREISDLVMQKLQLKGQEKIIEIELMKRKQLSIASLYELENCIAFDYYGLDPTGEEKVTELVRDKVYEGKSAIGFDNLYYLTEKEPYDFIKRIIVKKSH